MSFLRPILSAADFELELFFGRIWVLEIVSSLFGRNSLTDRSHLLDRL